MKVKYQADLDITMYEETLEDGMHVIYFPDRNYHQIYGLINVNFGSNDLNYLKDGKQYPILKGTAHFLEHKMFEYPNGDYDALFASYGAEVNAYTTFYRTCYTFYSSNHVKECTRLLLDLVQSFDVTKESVEKEKGIIIEEIHGDDDNPSVQCYIHSINNLYHDHPMKNDIGGDEESVLATTEEMLEEVYKAYYHPSNMTLFLAGNFDLQEMSQLIKEHQLAKKTRNYEKQERIYHFENEDVEKNREILYFDSHTKYISMTYKLPVINDPKHSLKHRVKMNMLCDLYFSKSATFYAYLLERDLVNDSFYYSYLQNQDFCYLNLMMSDDELEEFEKAIYNFVDHIEDFEITSDDFEIIKRMNIGSMIANLNSPASIVDFWLRFSYLDVNLFELFKLYQSVSYEEVMECRKYLKNESLSVCIVDKK